LDNVFYVYWHATSKKRKKSHFLDFEKKNAKMYVVALIFMSCNEQRHRSVACWPHT